MNMKKILALVLSLSLIMSNSSMLVFAEAVEGTDNISVAVATDTNGEVSTDANGQVAIEDIVAGESKLITVVAGKVTYLRFTPKISGIYKFKGFADSESYGSLYDSNMNKIPHHSADGGGNINFNIYQELEAGVTYYWGARYHSRGTSGRIIVQLTCTEAYCTHSNIEKVAATEVTCCIDGYTAGEKCNDCGQWASGHKKVEALSHTDEDGNDICDYCEKEMPVSSGACGGYSDEGRYDGSAKYYKYVDGTLEIYGEGVVSGDYGEDSLFSGNEIKEALVGEGITQIKPGVFGDAYGLETITILNPTCTISEERAIDYQTTIIGYKGSPAELYAQKYGRNFLEYCSHENTVSVGAVEADCYTYGYTAGEKCNDCGRWVSGHKKVEVLSHTDGDGNNICDYCGKEIPIDSGTCGGLFIRDDSDIGGYYDGSAKYYKYADGTLEIYGEGAVGKSGFNEDEYGIFGHDKFIEEVIVGEGITSVLSYAFYGCPNLRYITFLNPECTINDYGSTIASKATIIGHKGSTAETYAQEYGRIFLEYCPHENTVSVDAIEEGCYTYGYTAGEKCNDCGRWASGHKSVEGTHTDEGEDNICDRCGKEMPVSSGTCGGRLYVESYYDGSAKYYKYADGTLEIYGEGAVAIHEDADGWFSWDNSIKKVIVKEGITEIGRETCKYCDNLREVILPDSVTTIGRGAFSGCDNLSDITLSKNITSIGEGAFDEGTVIRCYKDSVAASYAETNNRPYVLLDVETVHNHKYTEKVVKEPTCTLQGETAFTCDCGDSYTETPDKLGHVYSTSYTTDKKADTAADGSKSRHCTRNGCDAKAYATPIPKIASIALSYTTKTYNGYVQKPTVTIKDSEENTLENGTDYILSYQSGCKDPGEYWVKVTFKGNYEGTSTKYFTINKATITGIKATSKTATYNGESHTITLSGVPSGAEIYYRTSENGAYSTTKPTRTDAGMTTVYYKVTMANYHDVTGSASIVIDKAFISDDMVKLEDSAVSYDGTAKEPTVTVKGLSAGEDFTVSYADNVNVGTATVTITGMGNYQGTLTKTFDITPANLDTYAENYDGVYDGKAHSITVYGVPEDVKVKYSTDGVHYSETKPTLTLGGEMTVYYKVDDPNCYPSEGSAMVSIKYNASHVSVVQTKEFPRYSLGQNYDFDDYFTVTNKITKEPLKINVDYAANYMLESGEHYAGNYTLDVVLFEPNYFAGEVIKVPFTIEKGIMPDDSISFEIIGGEVEYNEEGWTLGVWCDASIKFATSKNGPYFDECPTITKVGTTTVYYKITQPGYETYFGSVDLTIKPAKMSANVEDYHGIYDGKKHSVYVDIPEGATIKYATSQNGTYSKTKPTRTNIGTTTVYYKVSKANYEDVTGSAKITINKTTMTGIKAKSKTATYNGKSHTITLIGTPSGAKVYYKTSSNGKYSTTKPTRSSVGTTTIYYKVVKANYNDVTGSAKIVVNKATMNGIKAKSKTVTYNGKSHTISLSGIPSGAKVYYKTSSKGKYTTTKPTRSSVGTTMVYYKVVKANYNDVTGSAKIVVNQRPISTAALAKDAYTYTGKSIKPSVTVKNSSGVKLTKGTHYTVSYKNNTKVGKATVTITGKGNYKGTLKKTFKINPAATSITGVTAAKKAFTVKWKKVAKEITGYEIMYATNQKFTKGKKIVPIQKFGTISKKITGVKSKQTYYVKVCTYKFVKENGKNVKYYSDYSKVKTVKVK